MTSIYIQILSENSWSVVPTKTQYIMATGKQALELLHSAASVIPVPLLQDVIRVAIKIIETCEVREFPHRKDTRRFNYEHLSFQEASAVQQKVKELQNRVGHIMIVIVNNVTMKFEEDSEVIVKAVKGIEKDVKDLFRCASYTLIIVNC
jgi:hypothetical protein